MRAFTTTLVVVLLVTVGEIYAQERVVPVTPGVGTLNEAIDSDTTDTGERVDPENTVYELEAGGYYGLAGTIENRFPLYIRATEGPRAQLVPAVGEGGESGRAFEPRGNIRLENLYITNRDEAGGFKQRILRVRPDSTHVIIDNCHLDFDAQSGLRLDGEGDVIKITNSVFSNIGRAASLNNGRVIDTRGNDVDTVIFHNNTIYNITSRLYRDDGAFTKYAELTRNTVYNVAQHGISLGEVGELHMRDNIFVNAGFLGQSDSSFADRAILDVAALNPDRGVEQVLDVRYNYFVLNPAVVESHPDSVRPVQLVHPDGPLADLLDDETNVEVVADVEFVDGFAVGSNSDIAHAPAVPTDLITEFWIANTAGASEDDLPDMDNGGGGALPAPETLPFSFRYADTEPAATAAEDGLPLGDRNWFDLVGVAVEGSADLPASHRLVGNFPNPFNPSTTIQFELASNADVTIEIFDISGRKVMSLAAGALSAGTAEVRIDALAAPSGTYLYKVLLDTGAETRILSGTMTLLK
jgi:hypothetical protein